MFSDWVALGSRITISLLGTVDTVLPAMLMSGFVQNIVDMIVDYAFVSYF